MGDVLLSIRNLSKTYPGNKALQNISFDIRAGEVHAIVGENGAGKSTLIKLIAGAEIPDDGAEFSFDSKVVSRVSIANALKYGITVLYQDISLFPNLSVAENICIELDKGPFVSKSKMHEEAKRAIDDLGIDLDPSEKLGDISIGKQQLVALIRAVLFKSKIIIMDEPTAALSSSEVNLLYSIVQNLRAAGVAIIYISHKLEEIFYLADRITVLRDGCLITTDTVDKFDTQKLISLMVGRELRVITMRSSKQPGEEILGINNLTCEPYFRDVSFSLREYEILGITGLVGAGRSELAQTIFGILKPEQGSISVKGEPVSPDNPINAINKGICYLPEDRRTQGLFYGQSMIKNITSVTLDKYTDKFKLISQREELNSVKEYIKKISIRPPNPYIDVSHLSGGNQQKLVLSRWLDAHPKVLIVDEPTNGVDIGAKYEIHKLLRNLCEEGIGVILISSDLPEVLALSDRILVMRNGRLAADMDADDATQEGLLEKAIIN